MDKSDAGNRLHSLDGPDGDVRMLAVQVGRPLTDRRGGCVRNALAVGVDLGTTNSAVSVLRDGKPLVVPNEFGKATTPSVVTYLENGEILVGEKARRLASKHPKTTFSSVKRLLGREYGQTVQPGF